MKEETKSFFAVILVIVAMLALVGIRLITSSPEKARVADEETNARIIIDYPKNEGYRYVKEEESENGELSQEDGDYIINIELDKESLKPYEGDFEKYQEMQTASVSSEEITLNGVKGYGYYDKEKDQYQIVLPFDDFETIANINIRPKIRFSGTTGEDIYRREEIQELLKTIQIRNN